METSGGWGNGRSSRMTGLMCVSLVIFYCYQEEPLIYNSQASIFSISLLLSTDSGPCSGQTDKG